MNDQYFWVHLIIQTVVPVLLVVFHFVWKLPKRLDRISSDVLEVKKSIEGQMNRIDRLEKKSLVKERIISDLVGEDIDVERISLGLAPYPARKKPREH